MGPILLVLFLFFAIALLIVAFKTVRIVPQATALIIERLGTFSRLADGGLHILIPFIDRARSVYWTGVRPGLTSIDLREQFTDLPLQPVITKDNVTIAVDSVVYWQITDPIKAVYEVNDLTGGIMQLTLTAMRSVVGELELDHTLSSREMINTKLRQILDEATHRWGVKVTRVEVRNINPPEDVRVTMEKQMTAERNRRALVLQADGERQANITRAEGEKQAAITRAEGDKASAVLRAEGAALSRLAQADAESKALGLISSSLSGTGNPAHYLVTMRYIESLKEMAAARNSKIVFMPFEASGVLSSLGALKQVFSEQAGDAESDDAEPVVIPPEPMGVPIRPRTKPL
ncbi:MAG: SPFH/Band 7/PHB domain protein [Acidobacteria bacterium]|nr:SPFH/Band 7/PHB domain protein [Acidobacteriota bacterium]